QPADRGAHARRTGPRPATRPSDRALEVRPALRVRSRRRRPPEAKAYEPGSPLRPHELAPWLGVGTLPGGPGTFASVRGCRRNELDFLVLPIDRTKCRRRPTFSASYDD